MINLALVKIIDFICLRDAPSINLVSLSWSFVISRFLKFFFKDITLEIKLSIIIKIKIPEIKNNIEKIKIKGEIIFRKKLKLKQLKRNGSRNECHLKFYSFTDLKI